MENKDAKIVKLKTSGDQRKGIDKREVDILTSFQQELLKIDALIPNTVKNDNLGDLDRL